MSDFDLFNDLCKEFGLSCSYSETDVSFYSPKNVNSNTLNILINSLWEYKFEYISIYRNTIELKFFKKEIS